jgi:D-3-phosphoglycerate dehydrogenase
MNQGAVLYLGPSDVLPVVQEELSEYSVIHAASTEEVGAVIPGCVGVIDASMKIRFDASIISRASSLRAFATATTGATHIDRHALEARGVPLLTLQGQSEFLRNITPAAELSWMLLMMCARRARPAVQHVLDGRWDRTQFPGHMLNGRSLGIIGCGRIGQWMARYGAAFGMVVRGHDPGLTRWPDGIERCELDEVLGTCDFVSLHVPYSEQLRGMIGAVQVRRMKQGCIFINTARGELVDESALRDAILDGHLGGIGVDVLCGEPDTAGHPLVELAKISPNVVVTPHIGGFSPDALSKVVRFACARLCSALGEGVP